MALKRTSRTIIMDVDYKVLLGERPFDSKQRPGQLDFFGGAVEPGEPAAEAAVRELFEESGIDIGSRVLAHVYRGRDRDGRHTFNRDYWLARIDGSFDDISLKLTEHIGAVALPAVEAAGTLRFRPHREAMNRVLSIIPDAVLVA